MSKDYLAWRPHPWHGIEPGDNAPEVVTAYVEMTPYDLVKYEIDKKYGYIRVDRPQRSASIPPALYGFIPRTLCANQVAKVTGLNLPGDNDPLDVCIISERPIERANIILDVRVIGGLTMIDGGEVDDKIIGIFVKDNMYGDVENLSDLPGVLVERLVHYFETYKWIPGGEKKVEIREPYGREQACRVIEAALADYQEHIVEAD
ncbi:MAG: inorganic pyrophosphatase [Pseudomonadota bacterium]